jgi:REP element-mobilizing transposase RayT
MPRRTRIHIDGLTLHIVQRGHNRAACFFDDQDRLAYLGWLHEALGIKTLAVCRNRLINLLVKVQPMELLVHHCSAPERRLGNQGS